jgi:hypothetical protein
MKISNTVSVLLSILLYTVGNASAFTLPRVLRVWRLFQREEWNHRLPDFVVTTINVENANDSDDRVRFHGRMLGKPESEKATILGELRKEKDAVRGWPIYSGKVVKPEEFQTFVNARCDTDNLKIARNGNAKPSSTPMILEPGQGFLLLFLRFGQRRTSKETLFLISGEPTWRTRKVQMWPVGISEDFSSR